MTRGERHVQEARYWNIEGVGIAIVAVITEDVDWSAYIGATSNDVTEEETIKQTVMFGAKLSWKDARHFFPELEELPYRP